ncbi:MAG: hypothetical protein KatS3mg057_2629 [Herpetosiphonaceae bacterium]|nr:MAG: hypothetical protein KatS3mg057_2629 [Herpetosiphonaceae bacterium]
MLLRQDLPSHTARLVAPTIETDLSLVGFYGLERNAAFAYRWSSGNALVQMPFGANLAPSYVASARIRAAHPDGPQPLSFLGSGRALATVMPAPEFRVYRLLIPPVPKDDRLSFGLQTQPFIPQGDRRELGVMATSIGLQPLPYIEWPVVLVVPAALASLWGWMRRRGAGAGAVLLVCYPLGAGLSVLYALNRPAPLPFIWLALFTVVAAGVVVLLTSDVRSRLSLALLSLLVSFSGMIWPSWMTDDAFISFRYAYNLVAGHGLIYNVGERVEGYTNFLWTMLAALTIALGGDPVYWSYLSGVAIALAILLLSYWLAKRLLDPAWALVTALVVATSQSLLVYTARGGGLETGLFTLLVLAGSALFVHSRAWRWSGIVFALASLTRPEGALVMALSLFYLGLAGLPAGEPATTHSWRARFRLILLALLPYLLIVVPYFLWRLSYYGDPLPNTFYAKTGGGIRQALRGLAYAQKFALAVGGPLLLVVFIRFLSDWRAAWRTWRGYLLLLVIIYSAYVISVGGDHFPGERFFVPLVPWIALLIADGLAWLYTWAMSSAALRKAAPALLGAILLATSAHALGRSASFDHIIRGDDESVRIWSEIGIWLRDHAAHNESVAALGAGAIAYYSDRTTIDLLGLNDKHIARVKVENMGGGTAGHEKRDPEYVLHIRRPTYIPALPDWSNYFGGPEVLRQYYKLISIRTHTGRELLLWKRLP